MLGCACRLETLGAILRAEDLGGEPQTFQPAHPACGQIVLVGVTAVEHVVVVDELHVAGRKGHFDSIIGVVDEGVVGVHRGALFIAQSWGVRVALRGLDVGPDIAYEQPVAVLGEHRHPIERVASFALFTTEVVGKRVVEHLGEFWVGSNQEIVSGDGVGNQAFTARFRSSLPVEPLLVSAARHVPNGRAEHRWLHPRRRFLRR